MSPRAEHAERHDRAGEARADAADPVVRSRGRDARDSGAVSRPGRIGRVRVLVHEVVSRQHRACQVGVGGVDPGVDDRDDHVGRSGRQLPRRRQAERCVRGMACLRIAGREGSGCGCQCTGHRRGGRDRARALARTAHCRTVASALDSRHARRAARSRCRARARRLLDRHARTPRDPRAVRRGDHVGRVGAHVVQPRARPRRGARGVRRPKAAHAVVRVRCRGVRGRVARVRSRALVRGPRRRAVRSGSRGGGDRHRRSRPPLAGHGERRGRPAVLGRRRRARCRARARCGRDPHGAARLGVDLSRAGASRARAAPRASRDVGRARGCSGRAAVVHRERRLAPRRGRARRSALPRRPPARGRLGDVPGCGRRRRHGHAADRDRGRSHATPLARCRPGRCVRCDPSRPAVWRRSR